VTTGRWEEGKEKRGGKYKLGYTPKTLLISHNIFIKINQNTFNTIEMVACQLTFTWAFVKS